MPESNSDKGYIWIPWVFKNRKITHSDLSDYKDVDFSKYSRETLRKEFFGKIVIDCIQSEQSVDNSDEK